MINDQNEYSNKTLDKICEYVFLLNEKLDKEEKCKCKENLDEKIALIENKINEKCSAIENTLNSMREQSNMNRQQITREIQAIRNYTTIPVESTPT